MDFLSQTQTHKSCNKLISNVCVDLAFYFKFAYTTLAHAYGARTIHDFNVVFIAYRVESFGRARLERRDYMVMLMLMARS